MSCSSKNKIKIGSQLIHGVLSGRLNIFGDFFLHFKIYTENCGIALYDELDNSIIAGEFIRKAEKVSLHGTHI